MMNKTGIYMIINNITGKVYVGSAVNINRRWYNHKRLLNNNISRLPKLQNSVNKYGLMNFTFEIIEECPKELLLKREQYWIDKLDSYNKGYNSRPVANSNLGKKVSLETREKMRKSSEGRKKSEEAKKNMSSYWKTYYETHEVYNKGKTQEVSLETREKLRKAFKGKTYEEIYGPEKAEEMREKRRLSALNRNKKEGL